MSGNRWIAAATLLVGMGTFGAAALPAQQQDQAPLQTDQNGQTVNGQPHTKAQYNAEKRQEKHQLKHNKKADKAARKAAKEEDNAAAHRAKAEDQYDKANTPKPQ